MQNKKGNTTSAVNSAFVSKHNPKPDPKDMSMSTFHYEYLVKAHTAIEKLAAVDHDQWHFWSQSIMRDLDEMMTVIITLNQVCENLPSYHFSREKDQVQQIIKKHNERNSRWQKQWVAYKNLPEEVKEEDRVWAKKEWKALSDQK